MVTYATIFFYLKLLYKTAEQMTLILGHEKNQQLLSELQHKITADFHIFLEFPDFFEKKRNQTKIPPIYQIPHQIERPIYSNLCKAVSFNQQNTVKSRYLEVDGTIFYKFKLPEVHIYLHCTLSNLDLLKMSPTSNYG